MRFNVLEEKLLGTALEYTLKGIFQPYYTWFTCKSWEYLNFIYNKMFYKKDMQTLSSNSNMESPNMQTLSSNSYAAFLY